MAFDQAKFLIRFLEEAREQCSRINSGLLEIERHPGDAETMNTLFRAAHTIKGSSRMMKLLAVTEVAHKLEDVLDGLRGQRIAFSKGLSGTLFRAVDTLGAMLEQIASGGVIDAPPAGICKELEQAARSEPATGEEQAVEPSREMIAAVSPPPGTDGSPAPVDAPAPSADRRGENRAKSETIRVDAAKLDVLIKLMGEIVSTQGRWQRSTARIREAERLSGRVAELLAARPAATGSGEEREKELCRAARSLTEKLAALDALSRDDALLMEQLIGELQDVSLTMRMLPLATVFDSFPRTVRDLALTLGKEIDFIVEGGETELDKKIIEQIGDPLLHLIRNAVDHGIEPAEVRLKNGKRERGTIRLFAFYDGGSVTVAVQDDGRGISVDQIREKALQKRLFPEETLAKMSDTEIIDLIFLPGFSTSPIITDLSGRGVGMDVVHRNVVEELKGSIRVETRKGQGITFYLKLPLNLAVFRLLLVVAAGRTFALPATSVSEIVAVSRNEIIEVVHRKAFRLREQIIPVEELGRLLGIATAGSESCDPLYLAIVSTGNEKLALIVDRLLTEVDMVVKPLPSHMKNVRLVSGVALGSGNEIISVLQAPTLLKCAREQKEGRSVKPAAERRRISILVVDDSLNTRDIEKSILEAYGYSVDLAGDGMEALEKAQQNSYDAIITDVEMPRLDGFSLTERLRRDERYADKPIIIVTSREKDEDKRRGIAVGANAYIVKGTFEQSNLLETVQNLVG
ncbi:MAG: hybrid sensor histidine kinase/response regulator [Desulfuromonadales bacterium]|nr:hybrid sensor histidine kinase/response regulator [Desulfuromonadales bacterium]